MTHVVDDGFLKAIGSGLFGALASMKGQERGEPDRFRNARTFWLENGWRDIEEIPDLPPRLRVTEFKNYGLTGLAHRDGKETTLPWLRRDLYKTFDQQGRLYLLQVSGVRRGEQACVWCYRPIFRVKATTRVFKSPDDERAAA
jgi:hypothetical protein